MVPATLRYSKQLEDVVMKIQVLGEITIRVEILGSGDSEFEYVEVSDDSEMYGPETTTLGPRKMKRMMKRSRKRKPITQVLSM